jgi:hypothetical protein
MSLTGTPSVLELTRDLLWAAPQPSPNGWAAPQAPLI